MSRLVLLVTVIACCAGALSAQHTEGRVTVLDGQDSSPHRTEKALFASYRTVTRTGVTLATSTVYATCLSGIKSDKCTGKRRRSHNRKMTDIKLDKVGQSSSGLDGSINSSSEERTSSSENERLLAGAYTIWTTATTSTTVTITYTDSAITISLSYFCTAQGIQYPGIFCG